MQIRQAPQERQANITTTFQEIEDRSGMTGGLEVADIEIIGDVGEYTRFFVTLRLNKRGQVVAELSTNVGDSRTVRKTVTGYKRTRL